jgi:hypothetical protein
MPLALQQACFFVPMVRQKPNISRMLDLLGIGMGKGYEVFEGI